MSSTIQNTKKKTITYYPEMAAVLSGAACTLVVLFLLEKDGSSRVELSEGLGLSMAEIGFAVRNLIKERLVTEARDANNRLKSRLFISRTRLMEVTGLITHHPESHTISQNKAIHNSKEESLTTKLA